ncbi:uncharacterized protein N7500_007351 [Penicillium coprophilum]|uniref:uncharacterized protein n=1 Tax=Penicillium coprophilum TaxID=36646 RepID=UPI0023A094CF|nr:uncharacterized protein N7500_007351 [Penicillium coprophilum]KAJ5165521.1 hypothetical protein N7500_007351 [Penicillium coprophilum]
MTLFNTFHNLMWARTYTWSSTIGHVDIQLGASKAQPSTRSQVGYGEMGVEGWGEEGRREEEERWEEPFYMVTSHVPS